MNQEPQSSPLGNLMLAFLAGAAVGAVAVALTTRRTGPQFRGDIKDFARRAKRKADLLAEGASEAWDGLKERTVLAAGDLKRGVTEAAHDLRG